MEGGSEGRGGWKMKVPFSAGGQQFQGRGANIYRDATLNGALPMKSHIIL